MKLRDDYECYIVDVDGTLYFQKPVRLKMAFRLMAFYLIHPFRIKELFLIKTYREIREKEMFSGEDCFEEKQFEYIAVRYGMDKIRVREIIEYWMHTLPLSLIYKHRDKKLLDFLLIALKNGKKVIVYSDYPVKDKLKTLGVVPTAGYYSGDEIIGCMKPDPRGLVNIIDAHGLKREGILFIGDRQEKDGRCASAAGIECCILPGSEGKRKAYYEG